MRRASAVLAVLVAIAATASAGCGPKPEPVKVQPDVGIYWQDVFDGVPEVLFYAKPNALKSDAVYGELAKSSFRAAVARGVSSDLSQMRVLEDADEGIMGAGARSGGGVLVIRGVKAGHDPAKVSEGRAVLWHLAKDGRVKEYVRSDPSSNAGLYVLPDRTWVVVFGAARERARQAFATPQKRPEPAIDRSALVSFRVDGASLVERVPGLSRGRLAKVGNKLRALTLLVKPDKQGVEIRLDYNDDEATAWSERSVEQILEAFKNDGKKRWEFLKDAKLRREPTTVVVQVALPASLLEALPRATGVEVDPAGYPAQ